MASISISLRTGNGDYSVDVDYPETMAQAFGHDKSHLDSMIDEAVARVKRAYTPVTNRKESA